MISCILETNELLVQVSVSAPIGTVENKRIVASYGFIYTPVDLIGVFLCISHGIKPDKIA